MMDELDEYVAEALEDPAFRKAYERRSDRLGDCITKLLEDIRGGFWRGVDKLMYG